MGEVTLEYLKGHAKIKRHEYQLNFDAGTGNKVYLHDEISTAEDGYATLYFDDGSYAYVYPNSHLRFERLHQEEDRGDSTDTIIRLDAGQVFVDASTNEDESVKFQIITPGAKIFGKGASFFLSFQEPQQGLDPNLFAQAKESQEQATTRLAVQSGQAVVVNNTGKSVIDAGLAINLTRDSDLDNVTEMLPQPEILSRAPQIIWQKSRELNLYRVDVFQTLENGIRVWLDEFTLENLHEFDPNIYEAGIYNFKIYGWDRQTDFPALSSLVRRKVNKPFKSPQVRWFSEDVQWAPIEGAQTYKVEFLDAFFNRIYRKMQLRVNRLTHKQLPYGHYWIRVTAQDDMGTPGEAGYLEIEKQPQVSFKQLANNMHWMTHGLNIGEQFESYLDDWKPTYSLAEFSWPSDDWMYGSEIQIASDSDFNNLVYTAKTTEHRHLVSILTNTQFYVRVKVGDTKLENFGPATAFMLKDNPIKDTLPQPLIK